MQAAKRAPAVSPLADGLMTAAVAVLVIVGIAPALWRYLLSAETHMALSEKLYAEYATLQLPVLAAHPIAEALHRLGGTLYFLIGAMQFSPWLRDRHLKLHRITGYVFSTLSFLFVVPTAFYIVLAFPYNPHETLPTLLAGTYMLGCLANALRLIRQLPPKVQAHREWMTRAWAISLAIGLVRLLFLVAHYGAGMSGMRFLDWGFWAGWAMVLIASEWWIAASRRARGARRAPVVANLASARYCKAAEPPPPG